MAPTEGGRTPAALLLDLHYVMNMDTTAMDAIRTLHLTLRRQGTALVLCGPQAQPLSLMKRSRFHETIGEENIQPDLAAGLRRAADSSARRSSGASR